MSAILFDSNIWISQLGLRLASGSAVRLFVRQKGAFVAVPEVVQLEAVRHLKEDLYTTCDSMRQAHARLLAVFGTLKELVLPTREQVAARVQEMMSNLDVPIRTLPLTLEVARSALVKAIDKVPPSDKREQFKDALIWGHCIELLQEGDVYFVTQDKAFYLDREYSKGLAKNLAEEAATTSRNRVMLKPGLQELLEDIRVDLQVDTDRLVELVASIRPDSVASLLDRSGFLATGRRQVETSLFATESAEQLYLRYIIRESCDDARGEGRSNGVLELGGDGIFDLASQKYRYINRDTERLTFVGQDGESHVDNVIIAVGAAVLGHRSVHHQIRTPLDGVG